MPALVPEARALHFSGAGEKPCLVSCKSSRSPHHRERTGVALEFALAGGELMKVNRRPRLVLVTAPDRRVARRLAQAALKARLVACANIVPALESHYWWKGKIERGSEVLILFKTTARKEAALERLILEAHPYDTPEFISVSVHGATPRYLRWWIESCEQ